MNPRIKIFSGSATRELAEKISDFFGAPLGEVELLRFSDGEMQVYYEESIRGSDIFIVQSTFAPADTVMELLLMIDAARRASANQVIVVTPYYGYARQDRKFKSRVSVGAKLMANLVTAAGADRVVTMDLHAGQIQGFFDIPLDHLDASAVFVPYLKGLNLDNLCIASPDIGGSARARRYASFIGADLLIVDKHRKRPNEVASMQVIGDAKGKHIILVDDLIDTAGTICKAADLLMDEGALSVRAIATHPLLSGDAYKRIEASSLLEVCVTDTIPLSNRSVEKVKVLSIAPVFAKAFRKIHNYESISSLFIS
jgi:ribose-phosphate pyrophosphokinase